MAAFDKARAKKAVKTALASRWAAVVGLALIFGLLVWLNHIHNDPKRVFWGMLANNLSTYSVTKESVNDNGLTKTDEISRMIFGPNPRVHNLRKFSDSSNGPTIRLNLESLATPTDIYQRYRLIDQPGLLGERKPDYSALYKLWLRNGGGNTSGAPLFSSNFFGPLLFGNLSLAQRAELLDFYKSHDVYKVDYSKTDHGRTNRRSLTFIVTINLHDHAAAAKLYAQMTGLPLSLAPNPDSYNTGSQIQTQLTVDVLNRQLRELTYSQSVVKEKYTAYGITGDISPPAHTASIRSFQKALNAAHR